MIETNTPLIAGIIFAVFSTWMLFLALRGYKKALQSLRWSTTTGEIRKIELWGKRNVGGQIQEVEKLSIEYAFNAQDEAYESSRVAFYTLIYPETVKFANSHPLHSKVSVYYDTGNPADSVLIPGPRPGNKRYSDIILASAGLLISLGVALLGALGKIG